MNGPAAQRLFFGVFKRSTPKRINFNFFEKEKKMKKLLVLIFAMLLLGSGIASATDVEVTGSYYARGSYYDNVQATPGNNLADFQEYDHELSVDVTFKIDDTTKVFTRIEAMDNDWGRTSTIDASMAAKELTSGDNLKQLDDNIVIEQVYGEHTFGNGTNLKVGLMSGGSLVWGPAAFNNGFETYRIFLTQPTSVGTVIAIAEKNIENGNTTDGDENDKDTYYLGLLAEYNGINVQPIVAYQKIDNTDAASRADVFVAVLALSGQTGNVGWEAEADYLGIDYDQTTTDIDVYGLYGNVWIQANALKIGVLAMYASFDDTAGAGLCSGDDFSAGGALIMGDDIHFNEAAAVGQGSAADNSGDDLTAPTLFALYADYQLTPKVTVGGYLGYAQCNDDVTGSIWNGADIWEIDADVTYAITPNLEYQVAAGTAQMSYGEGGLADPDRSVEVYHKLTFNF
jgi:hypothetical protein